MGKQYCHKIPYKTILFIQAFACYCFAGKIRNVWKADNSKVSPNNWIPKKLLCAFVWIQVWRHPNLSVYIQCTHLILISAGRWKSFALVDLLKPGGWFNRSHMETGEWRGLITGRQSLSSCKPHTGLSAPKIRVRRSFVQETLIWQKTDTLPPSSLSLCHHHRSPKKYQVQNNGNGGRSCPPVWPSCVNWGGWDALILSSIHPPPWLATLHQSCSSCTPNWWGSTSTKAKEAWAPRVHLSSQHLATSHEEVALVYSLNIVVQFQTNPNCTFWAVKWYFWSKFNKKSKID